MAETAAPEATAVPTDSFTCRLELKAGRAVLECAGRFDFHARTAIAVPLEQALATPRANEVVVGLRGVGYVDSAALGQLLIMQDKAAKAGKQIAIDCPPGRVLSILRMANFDKRFTFIGQ